MDHLQRGILALLRSAVTGENLALPEQLYMEEVFLQIRRHQILPLAYEGAIRCGMHRTLPVMQKMFQKYLQSILHSERQMGAIRQLFSTFNDAGIDYMPLRGCNLKKLYPKPEMRLMEDADILIRTEQYEVIKPIMLELGYEEKRK